MKTLLLFSLLASLLIAHETANIGEVFQKGSFSADIKLFHMTRTFKDTAPDTKAFTGGGILKYESGKWYGGKIGFAYYGSHKIGGFYTRKEGIRTSLLQSDGEDIAFLGEAYVRFDMKKTLLQLGRQRLDTPMMGDLRMRILPTTYEALRLKNESFAQTSLEIGYVKRYSGFGSRYSDFVDKNGLWGKSGLGYCYITNNTLKNLHLRAQYIYALDSTSATGTTIARRDYRYADLRYDIDIGEQSYFKAQYGGNNYTDAPNSTLFGAKVATTFFGMLEGAAFYDKILHNNFIVVMASPMFSDWQQGYGLYEPSEAYGGVFTLTPIKRLRVRAVYVDVHSHTQKLVDDFKEYNFDIKYTCNDISTLRISYSFKDQSDASERLHQNKQGGREDRNDLRIIYSLRF